jgi:RNA polymerase sigma-70 factor, ECF subfamily
VGNHAADVASDEASDFLRFYDEALPHVFGYLARRCGTTAVAEDLCAETFLAAVDAVRSPAPPPVSVAWAIGVARHKLVDHWRRQARDERRFEVLSGVAPGPADPEFDPDAVDARRVLDDLIPQHRAALTLRYLDDLPVPQVAELLRRSVHATEALLVRARAAFRRAYAKTEGRDV